MKYKIALFLLIINCTFANAQDDLFKELDSIQPINKKEITPYTFKALQICTMQSTKLAAKGEVYVLISHRFGDLTEALDNFFGLDYALTKIGGLYGITDWLTIGASRQTYNKNYEIGLKYKLMNQEIDGFPVTIVGYNTFDIRTDLKKEVYPNLQFNNRVAFTTQLPISRKFSEWLSLEINPIYVHKNLYEPTTERKDQFLLGFGGRYKLTKRLSVNLEYANKFGAVKNSPYTNPLTAGLDIETGGHVFQMVFSNSQPMNDVAYFTNGTGDWTKKGIYFGFNVYRVF